MNEINFSFIDLPNLHDCGIHRPRSISSVPIASKELEISSMVYLVAIHFLSRVSGCYTALIGAQRRHKEKIARRSHDRVIAVAEWRALPHVRQREPL